MWEIARSICSCSAQACQATQIQFLVSAFENRRIDPGEEPQRYLIETAHMWSSVASRPFQVPGTHRRTARDRSAAGLQYVCLCAQVMLIRDDSDHRGEVVKASQETRVMYAAIPRSSHSREIHSCAAHFVAFSSTHQTPLEPVKQRGNCWRTDKQFACLPLSQFHMVVLWP